MPAQRPPAPVSSQSGFRVFVLAVVLACVAGVALRLYFNPERIKSWADHALAESGSRVGLKFQTARLRLSDGALPSLAIEVLGLQSSPAFECRPEPAIEIARARLPLDFGALLTGRLAVGQIYAEDISVDLDALKQHCGAESAVHPAKPARAIASTPAVAPARGGAVQPWWTADAMEGLRRQFRGLKFKRVRLWFENKTKYVDIESFAAGHGDRPGEIKVAADLVIPKELSYGEILPPLRIEAQAEPNAADVEIKAGLSEGRLVGRAHLKPARDMALDVDMTASVVDVPLSTLAPLVTRSGMVKGDFRPRFLWMTCEAAIQGRFQGLLNENPLTLHDCSINGQSSQIQVQKAVREPDGHWRPFAVLFKDVDLGRLNETFNWQGPEGTFSDYGRLSGQAEVRSSSEASFSGELKDAQLRFSHRSVRVLQRLKKVVTHFEMHGDRFNGGIDGIDFEGGDYKGKIVFDLEHRGRDGDIHAEIETLKLSPNVQALLWDGSLDAMSGKIEAHIGDGRLHRAHGAFTFDGLHGREMRFERASVQADLANPDGEFQLRLESPSVEWHRGSSFFASLRPFFFAHEFDGDWVATRDLQIRGHLPREGGFRWEQAQTSLEGGHIRLTSTGSFNRDREIQGWVSLDYPAVKKLKWRISGRADELTLEDDSKNLIDLRRKAGLQGGLVTNAQLGLPNPPHSARPAETDEPSMADKTREGLKEFGEKMIRKAKKIMPAPGQRVEASESE